MENSKKITLYLSDGLPRGIREIKIDQWSGRAICGPRSRLNDILKFKELENGACLYLLIGDPDDGGLLNVYIGEADGIRQRVKHHEYQKDWWNTVVIFYSSDGSLTKTGAEYLESVCCERLTKMGKCSLMNGNIPALPSVPKEDISGLELFYKNISLLVPLLGFDIFITEQDKSQKTMGIELFCSGKGAKARALLLQDGKIKVFKDSTAIKNNAPAFERHNYKKLKDELVKMNRLVVSGDYLLFSDDYVFDSSSAAAAIVLARSASGPIEWKNDKGKKLKDII